MNTKDSLIQFIKYQLDRYADNPDDYSQEDISEAKTFMANIESGVELSYLQGKATDNFQCMILSDYEEFLMFKSDLRAYHKWLTEVGLAVPVDKKNEWTSNPSHYFIVNKILWRQI